MAQLNPSKKVIVKATTELPHDDNFPINKTWEWKPGEQPKADEDGLITYPVIDSVVLGTDGLPKVTLKHMPIEFANELNYVQGKRAPYPPPSDELAPDEEFYVAGPGMFGIRKKVEKKLSMEEMITAIYKQLIGG